MLGQLLEWDQDILIFLNNLGSEPYDGFWQTITKYPPWIPLFILFLLGISRLKYWKETLGFIILLAIMVLFVETFTNLTKLVVERVRPNNDEAIKPLIRVLANPLGFSFFSAHAAISFSVTTLIYRRINRYIKWTYLIYIWPILFVSSRIYLGVHYPSDILVGAFFGILSAWLFDKLYTNLILPYLVSSHP